MHSELQRFKRHKTEPEIYAHTNTKKHNFGKNILSLVKCDSNSNHTYCIDLFPIVQEDKAHSFLVFSHHDHYYHDKKPI